MLECIFDGWRNVKMDVGFRESLGFSLSPIEKNKCIPGEYHVLSNI